MDKESFLKTVEIITLFYRVDIPEIKNHNFLRENLRINPAHRTSEGLFIYMNDRIPLEAYTLWGGINCFDPIIKFFRSGGTFDYTPIFKKGRKALVCYSLNGSLKKEESAFLEFDVFPKNTMFPSYVYCGKMRGCQHFLEEWKDLSSWGCKEGIC
ncbi:MAG TPA: hypothetical protein PLD77_02725 [Candidatus Dojkabacteria bacterium]|nr:hypothetical protein [Candidatus Dojkabacteria bacterium]